MTMKLLYNLKVRFLFSILQIIAIMYWHQEYIIRLSQQNIK